uniref:Uncharacterized protein n=1 Tax=Plectus sambesii TaxID=2011161 RepID=A0A914VTF4_9BILA
MLITSTTPKSLGDGNGTATANVTVSSSTPQIYTKEVNVTAGLTLAVTVTSGRLLLYASVCAPPYPGILYLNTTGAEKQFLDTAMLQYLYSNTSNCSPPNKIFDHSDQSKARGFIPTNNADVPNNFNIYTTVFGGSDSNSSSGTLTVGEGDVPVGGTTTTTTTTQLPLSSDNVKTGELTTAEIVLISVGGVALIAIALVIIVMLIRRHKKKQRQSHNFADAGVAGTISQTFID